MVPPGIDDVLTALGHSGGFPWALRFGSASLGRCPGQLKGQRRSFLEGLLVLVFVASAQHRPEGFQVPNA